MTMQGKEEDDNNILKIKSGGNVTGKRYIVVDDTENESSWEQPKAVSSL